MEKINNHISTSDHSSDTESLNLENNYLFDFLFDWKKIENDPHCSEGTFSSFK